MLQRWLGREEKFKSGVMVDLFVLREGEFRKLLHRKHFIWKEHVPTSASAERR
jgi:hypothetical protein